MKYEELSEIERKALNTSMFKAYDIRTKSAELHAPLMLRLVKAIGRYFIEVLQVSSVVVGRAARLAAPPLLELAIEVFADMGLDFVVNPLLWEAAPKEVLPVSGNSIAITPTNGPHRRREGW